MILVTFIILIFLIFMITLILIISMILIILINGFSDSLWFVKFSYMTWTGPYQKVSVFNPRPTKVTLHPCHGFFPPQKVSVCLCVSWIP